MGGTMSEEDLKRWLDLQPKEDNKGETAYRDALERIRQLEKLNATLAAEIDRMRPVVEATVKQVRRDDDRFSWSDLKQAVDTYEANADGPH